MSIFFFRNIFVGRPLFGSFVFRSFQNLYSYSQCVLSVYVCVRVCFYFASTFVHIFYSHKNRFVQVLKIVFVFVIQAEFLCRTYMNIVSISSGQMITASNFHYFFTFISSFAWQMKPNKSGRQHTYTRITTWIFERIGRFIVCRVNWERSHRILNDFIQTM